MSQITPQKTNNFSYGPLASHVERHLQIVTNLLQGSLSGPLRKKLTSAAGETAALAGWLAFDLNNIKAANSYYRVAVDAAKQAGDAPLLGCVLTYASYLANASGNHQRARSLLEQAERHSGGFANAASQAWIAARLAEECASTSDESAAMAALDRARTAFETASGGEQRAWTRFYDRSRLGSMEAMSHLTLGRTSEAGKAAESVLAALVPAQRKKRAIALVDVAAVRAREGELQAAGHLVIEALDIAVPTESRVALRLAQSLRDQLAVAGSKPLPELDARLEAGEARSLL